MAKPTVVVSNFSPRPVKTWTIDPSKSFRSTPLTIVMPIVVPRKPRIGMAQ